MVNDPAAVVIDDERVVAHARRAASGGANNPVATQVSLPPAVTKVSNRGMELAGLETGGLLGAMRGCDCGTPRIRL